MAWGIRFPHYISSKSKIIKIKNNCFTSIYILWKLPAYSICWIMHAKTLINCWSSAKPDKFTYWLWNLKSKTQLSLAFSFFPWKFCNKAIWLKGHTAISRQAHVNPYRLTHISFHYGFHMWLRVHGCTGHVMTILFALSRTLKKGLIKKRSFRLSLVYSGFFNLRSRFLIKIIRASITFCAFLQKLLTWPLFFEDQITISTRWISIWRKALYILLSLTCWKAIYPLGSTIHP